MFSGNLRLHGHVVQPSGLTQRPHRCAPCEVLLKVTPKTRKAALAAFQREGALGGDYRGFTISGLSDLSFLKDFPDLLFLEIDGHKQRINPRHLDGLANLRGLKISTAIGGVDFSRFPELEAFWGDWHADNRGIAKCNELRRLNISHYNPPSRDLAEFAGLIRLEDLGIVQTNIASLAGIEPMEDLRDLLIGYAPKLESLDSLAHHDSIREIEFETVKHIKSYEPIAKIQRLRRLMLFKCAPMSNLTWIVGMKHLDFFTFVDTNVVDGDLSPLLKLPRLRSVGTLDKKHYSHTEDELEEALARRGGTGS
jgi:protein phosphatase 1 regulatory subunit 7